MKILYPIGGFYPDQTGGPSNTVYWMAKALVKQGHEVTVVTTDFGLMVDILQTNGFLSMGLKYDIAKQQWRVTT